MENIPPQQQEDMDFLDYCESFPQDYEAFKKTRMFRSIIKTLEDKNSQTKEILVHSGVISDEDVRKFNHDQGVLAAAEEIKSLLENPFHYIEQLRRQRDLLFGSSAPGFDEDEDSPDDRGNYIRP